MLAAVRSLLLPFNVFFLVGLFFPVDIILTGAPWGYVQAATTNTCTDIQPGECCMAIALDGARTARFDHLAVGDIAAVCGTETRLHSVGFSEGMRLCCSGLNLWARFLDM